MNTDNPYNPPGATVADITAANQTLRLQVRRLSPHQNAKVFAVLFAVTSLIFLLPFGLLASAFSPPGMNFGLGFIIGLPVIYLVFGYVSTALGCMLYNFLFKFVGGIEYESDTQKV